MSTKPLDLVDTTKKIRRFFFMLDGVGESFSLYDPDFNTIVVTTNWNYKIPKQCPGKSIIVLFEEDCEDSGNKPIVGFQIKGVRGLLLKYDISPMNGKLSISQILSALFVDDIGRCQQTAAFLARELSQKSKLDEVEFTT